MILELNKDHISSVVLFFGAAMYIFYVHAFEFIPSAIILLVTALLWISVNIYFDSFDKSTFSKLLCFMGVVFSLSLFFFFGVEELPYPQGALVIHTSGIAMSLFSVLVSVVPMLLITQDDAYQNNDPVYIEETNYTAPAPSTSSSNASDDYNDDEWEEATAEDVESGEFEVPA